MSHGKLGIKTLGLCLLAALSAMAVIAAGTQANPGHVYVDLVLLDATVGVEALKAVDITLLSTFGAGNTPINVRCTQILVHDGLLFTNGSGKAEILLSNCDTLISGLVKANCKPTNEPITAKVKSLLIHHTNDTYVLFSPQVGLVFTTLNLGEMCAAGENVEITGHAVVECGLLGAGSSWAHEDCNVEKIEHQIRQAPGALFSGDQLKFGSKVATLDGDIELVANGNHLNKKWGVEVLLP